MILADVNVLLYAFRTDSPKHSEFKNWLEAVVNGDMAYGMSPHVLCSLMRIATHPRIYVQPSRWEEVQEFADLLLAQPHCQIVVPGSRHWGIFCHLCRSVGATGNLVQDAWLAAMAIEAGCEWITTDRDFARFEDLRWRTPF